VSAYDTVPGGQEPEATRSRRPLVLTLVLLLVVGMAAGAAWWVLGDDAAPDVVDVAAPAPATASPASDTDVSVADGDVELVALPTATYEIFLARDPFEPVVPEDVQSGEGTAATPGQRLRRHLEHGRRQRRHGPVGLRGRDRPGHRRFRLHTTRRGRLRRPGGEPRRRDHRFRR
jgi:hypothetical protein